MRERLDRQIQFITEIDKSKQVFRQNVVIGTKRNENDAEHAWHLAVMAFLLFEYAKDSDLDVLKVMKMAVVHDLVEIDAGDTFCYDEKGCEDKEAREQRAADRLFNILPEDQAKEIMALWHEFDAEETPEARFAASLDRLQPLILNCNTEGHTWKKPGVTSEKVLKRNGILEETVPELWDYVKETIAGAVEKGYLRR